MRMLDPKSLHDAKTLIDKTVGGASKGGIAGKVEDVQKAIDNLMKDKTVFVIDHRLSTVQNADRIAVINQGQLVELGNHNELMQIENGQYRHLYEMQFKKTEEGVNV